MHIFTDGSKSNGKPGYSVIAIGHHDTIKISRQRISNFASAFEAEALALNEALKLSQQLSEKYSAVKIYTDSKSCLGDRIFAKRTVDFIIPHRKPGPSSSIRQKYQSSSPLGSRPPEY
jgi:ribonuclease HI